jgi:hypothetical protein
MSNPKDAVISVVSTSAAVVGAAAAVSGAVLASGALIGIAAAAGGTMIAANVASRLMLKDKAEATVIRGDDKTRAAT